MLPKLLRLAALSLSFLICGSPSELKAGIVGLDRKSPDIGAWAHDLLQQNQSYFNESARLYSEGKIDECRNALVKLRESNATLPQPDLVLVWLLLSDRRLDEAKARLESLAALVPRDPQVAMTLGQVAIAEQRYADAAAQLERAALLQLPEVWSEKQRNEFAYKVFQNLALTYERQLRWQDLKPVIASLIRLSPKDPSHLVQLALAHVHLREIEEAKGLLEGAARLTGGATPPELLMADVAFSAGQMKDAEEAIEQARSKYPDNFNVHLWHAEWMLLHGDLTRAEESLTLSQRLGASSSTYWVPQGQLLVMKGDFAAGITAFRTALRLLEKEHDKSRRVAIEDQLALALTCSADGIPTDEAIAIAEKNALENSTNASLVATLGWVYLKSGKQELAQQLLNRAMDMNSVHSANLDFFMADFYYSKGEFELAKRALQFASASKQGVFLMRVRALALLEATEAAK